MSELVVNKDTSSSRSRDDLLGIILSFACLIHCIGVSMALAAMPLFEHQIEHSHFHAWFAVAVIVVGALAFGRGFCLHRSVFVLLGAILGIASLGLGLWLEEHSIVFATVFTVVGSVLLIVSHLRNNYLGKRCRGCCTH